MGKTQKVKRSIFFVDCSPRHRPGKTDQFRLSSAISAVAENMKINVNTNFTMTRLFMKTFIFQLIFLLAFVLLEK